MATDKTYLTRRRRRRRRRKTTARRANRREALRTAPTKRMNRSLSFWLLLLHSAGTERRSQRGETASVLLSPVGRSRRIVVDYQRIRALLKVWRHKLQGLLLPLLTLQLLHGSNVCFKSFLVVGRVDITQATAAGAFAVTCTDTTVDL